MKIRYPAIDITSRLHSTSRTPSQLLRRSKFCITLRNGYQDPIGHLSRRSRARYPTWPLFKMAVQSKHLPTVNQSLELFKIRLWIHPVLFIYNNGKWYRFR